MDMLGTSKAFMGNFSEPSRRGINWVPLGDDVDRFTGTFDGNGKKLDNLAIETTGDNVGLFSYVGSGGVIMNVNIVSGTVVGNDYVGGVAGHNDGSITLSSN
jgi:hypothetical protein